MDRFAYILKSRLPFLFRLIERLARWVTQVRFGTAMASAQGRGTLRGRINDRDAKIRPLTPLDTTTLHAFFASLPEQQFQFFRPHGFGQAEIRTVLASRAYANYAIFLDERLVAYALLKLAPTGTAYIGLLVSPRHAGLGLGKLIVHYLHWQAGLAGLKTRSTISEMNPASMRCHEAVSSFRVIARLPNDYVMIELVDEVKSPPQLGA